MIRLTAGFWDASVVESKEVNRSIGELVMKTNERVLAAIATTIATLSLSTSVQAATTVEWIGGTDIWRSAAGVWDVGGGPIVPTDSFSVFGDDNGWEFDDGAIADPDIIIDGPTSHVFYDQGFGGDPAGNSRDFRIIPSSSSVTGKLTISGGASFSMESEDIDQDEDGMWTTFSGQLLTITGTDSLMRRAFGGSGSPFNQSAGKMQLRGIRTPESGTTSMLIADGGRFENDGGQFNFGDFGRGYATDSTVHLTIDGKSSLDSRGGGNFDYLGGILGGAGNASIMFFRGWDSAGVITDEDYNVDFTGHGGTITTDEAGILVVQQTGPDTGADYDFGSLLSTVVWEDLWSGLARGGGADIPAGMLSATGKSGATGHFFGDHFITTGTVPGGPGSGTGDYKLVNIQGAVAGGSNPGDITGDGSVNGVDVAELLSNFSTGTLVSEGDINLAISGDDLVDAADAGVMYPAYIGGPGPPGGTVSAEYDPVTGQIIVSVNDVNNWYIESASSSLTAAAPSNLPGAAGLVTDHDTRIGETASGVFTYTDVDLGFIAAPGLPVDDLTIYWNAGFGVSLQSKLVVPEPTTVALTALGILGIGFRRRKKA